MPYYAKTPFEVPKGWEWTNIGNLCLFENGYAFSSSEYKDFGTPLIRISNIKDRQISLDNCVYVQGSYEEKFQISKGDLLIAMSGATTGKMGVYSIGNKAYLNQRVGNIKIIDPQVLYSKYRDLFFQSKTDEILKLAYGGAQPNISSAMICNIMIPLPPIKEQKRIVAAINHWFSLIDIVESGEKDIQSYINQAKSKILDLAIHGKLVPQDPNDEPASELLHRINPKAAPMCDIGQYGKVPFEVPKGWKIVQMQDICSIIDGKKIEGTLLPNLDAKFLRKERAPKILNAGKFIAKDDFLILVDGENSGEVFKASVNGYQGSTFKQLYIDKNMNADYVLQVINLHRRSLRENKIGSAIPHLNKKLFKTIEVPLPPLNEQKRIVARVEELYSVIDKIASSLQN